MDFQDLIEQSYLKLSTKEHRKTYAQFFTPPAIASLMAAYILDNPECSKILDPANGLSIFARALDEHLKLINHSIFDSHYQMVNTLSYSSWHPINQSQSLRFAQAGVKRSSLSSLFYNYDELTHILALSQLPLELCLSLDSENLAPSHDSTATINASIANTTVVASDSGSLQAETMLSVGAPLEWITASNRFTTLQPSEASHDLYSVEQTTIAHYHNAEFENEIKTEVAQVSCAGTSLLQQIEALDSNPVSADELESDEIDNDDDNGLFAANFEAASKLRAHLPYDLTEKPPLEPALHGTEFKQINAYSLLLKFQYQAPAQLNVQKIEQISFAMSSSIKDNAYGAYQAEQAETEEKGLETNAKTGSDSEILCISTGAATPARRVQLAAFEVDPIIAEFASLSALQLPMSYVDVKFRLKDYLKSNFKDRYDGIICNPPYKTFKEFARKSQSITLIEERLDLKLSGRTNLYALFLLKSIYQLKPNGRCAYLIPYEFLNSSFGIKIKEQFLKQRNLAYVITFDVKGPIFDNATTTCGLFLFDNAQEQKHVEFITLHTIDEIEQLMIRLCPNLIASYPESHQSFQRYLSLLGSDEEHSIESSKGNSTPSLIEGLMRGIGTCRQVPDDMKQALALSPSLIYTLPNPMLNSLLKQAQGLKAGDAGQEPSSDAADTKVKATTTHTHEETIKADEATIKAGDTNRIKGYLSNEELESKQSTGSASQDQSSPLSLCQGRIVPYSQLKAKQKWHIYYQDRSTELPPETSELMHKSSLATFDQFIKVKRGLATGANEFFLFNRSKVEETKIPLEYFVKVIPRANLIQRPIFTEQDLQVLEEQDALVYLLNAPNNVEDANLKRYLAYGESNDIHRRYLTRHRCPWYALERRQVAPILVSVFNRGSIQVIRNEAQIFNLTTFHSIFVLQEDKTDLIFAYLLTNLAKEIILQNRREYGGGLEKLEPLDINHAACINFNQLTASEEQAILELYSQYRAKVLANTPASLSEAEQILDSISSKFQALV